LRLSLLLLGEKINIIQVFMFLPIYGLISYNIINNKYI
jgi:hypothetical protein